LRNDYILLTNILTLIGAFAVGFLAGLLFNPVRRLLRGLWRAPGQVIRGARGAGAQLRQALSLPRPTDEIDRSTFKGFLAGLISDALTFRARRAEAAYRDGLRAFEEGRYGEARRCFRAALRWDYKGELIPLQVQAHLRLGWLAGREGDLAQAAHHYEEACRLAPDNREALVSLGMVYFRLGRAGPAISRFQRALELAPGDLETHYHLHAIYRQKGMEKEATEQLRLLKAGERAETLARLFARHGEENFAWGEHDLAADDLRLSLQFAPRQPRVYLLLGDLYLHTGQPRAALEVWTRGYWHEPHPALRERLTAVVEELGDPWPVIAALEEALAHRPQHPDAAQHFLLLSDLYRLAGDEEKGREYLERTIQTLGVLETPRVSPGVLAAAHEALAEEYQARGEWRAAADRYRAALAALHAGETVYRCRKCGYTSAVDQPHCFRCGGWHTFVAMRREEIPLLEAPSPPQVIRERAGQLWRALIGPPENGGM